MYSLIYLFIDTVHLLIHHVFFFLPSFPFYVFIHTYTIHTYLFQFPLLLFFLGSLFLQEPYNQIKETETLSWRPVMFLSFSHPPTLSRRWRKRRSPCCATRGTSPPSALPRRRMWSCEPSPNRWWFVSIGVFGEGWRKTKTHKSWEKMTFSGVISSFGGYVILMISNSFGGVIFFLEGHD